MEAQKSRVFANAGASVVISKKRHDRHAHSRSVVQCNGDINNANKNMIHRGSYTRGHFI